MQKLTLALLFTLIGISLAILYQLRHDQGKMVIIPAILEDVFPLADFHGDTSSIPKKSPAGYAAALKQHGAKGNGT